MTDFDKNTRLHEALSQATQQWEIKDFVVLSKQSKLNVHSAEGMLRTSNGEGIEVKLYKISALEADPDLMTAKINKWIQQGRLGGTTEDGTFRFQEDVAHRLNATQKFIIKNSQTASGAQEEITGSVEAISNDAYLVVQAALKILAAVLSGAPNETDKTEDKIKPSKKAAKPARIQSTSTYRPTAQPQVLRLVNAIISQLNAIVKRQVARAREEREKEMERKSEAIKVQLLHEQILDEQILNEQIANKELDEEQVKTDIEKRKAKSEG